MAKVTSEPCPLPEYDPDDYDSYDEYMEDEREAASLLDGEVVTFPIADGCAVYRVVDYECVEPCDCCGRGGEPLLQHIPYGDAYRAAGSTIRGFTTDEARRRSIEASEFFR